MQRVHKHSLRCGKVAHHIQTELDVDLDARKCREIKRHLERCPNCTAYLDSLKKTVLLYKRYPDPHVPSRTRETLFAILKISR